MDTVIRALGIYLFLLLVVRISGRRTLGDMTVFDLVLTLIISEATQQGLLGEDFSLINAWIVIATFFVTDALLALLKAKLPRLERILDGVPSLIVHDGKPIKDVMKRAGVDENDILESARKNYGIGTLSGIKHAILERDGKISIIPQS
jgi:uncharacterized membrane protein YcaP (DUF421 family)